MSVPVPSLSQDGWVYDAATKADYLLSHIFLSNYSQTLLFRGQVTSFSKFIQQYKGKKLELINASQAAFQDYFSRYFDQVTVQVDVVDDSKNANKQIYKIFVGFVKDDGTPFNLGMLGEFVDSKFSNVVRILNG